MQTSRISTTSCGRSRTTSIGSHTVSTFPLCWAFRSLFDGLDGIDALDAQIANAVTDLQAVDALLPQMITQLKMMMDDTQSAAGRHRQLVRPGASAVHADRPDLRRPDQRGQRLRPVPQRRLLLHAPRGVRQRRRQNRYDADDVAGRQGGPVHRHPRGQRHGPRRHRTRRAVPRRHQGSVEGDLVGRREDLHRRRGIEQQGHQGSTPLPISSSWRSPRSC